MTNVSLTDTLDGLSGITMTWPGKAGTLEAGQTATGTAKYNVKQSDIDKGNVTNTVSATGTNSTTGNKVTSNTAKVTTGIDRTIQIGVTKTADPTNIPAAKAIPGTNIAYTIAIRNNGNTTINIAATDSMQEIGSLTLSKTTLAPGETATATAKHTITQSEINAGTVTNTVSATGTTTDGKMGTSGQAKATTTIEKQSPKLTIEKTVDKTKLTAGESKAGTKLTYSFKITNAGNVTINDIAINDELNGLSDINIKYQKTQGELAAGETATGTATYAITLNDIANTHISNTAKATGKNKTTGATVTSNESTADTSIVKAPSMTLTKTSDPKSVTAIDAIAGHEITYDFEITNTGNTAISNIEIADSMKEIGTIKPTKASLNPGEKTAATATHKLTQAEIDAGTVTNTATAKGSTGTTPITSNEAKVTTSIEKPVSKLTLEKTVDKTNIASNEAKPGAKLTYTFKLTNGGNIPINGIDITDKLHGLSDININWNGHDRSLPAGASAIGTATYQITQEDIDAGTIKNTATATGTDAHGNKLTSTSDVTTDIARSGKLETMKTADKATIDGSEAKPGALITYTITVRNTGNVTLHNVTCDDSMKEIGKVSLNKMTLAPNETATGTATHTLTQSDIDSGIVKNTASSSADSPDASKVVSNKSTVTTSIKQSPQLTVEKTADRAHIGADEAQPGATIAYTLKITNTGNTTITGTELTDELAKDNLKVDWENSNKSHTLIPGTAVDATTTYKITEDDITKGTVENTAQASGKTTTGTTIKSNIAKAATTIEKSEPAISLTKTGTEQIPADDAKPGTEIEFDFALENTGNTTLHDITITDQLNGISDIKLEKTELTAGEKTTGEATYQITQKDIDAGIVKNIAKVNGKTPADETIESNESEHDVPISTSPSLSLEKAVDKETVTGTADELKKTALIYTFSIKNTGNVTITGIGITDKLNGLSNITFGTKKEADADDVTETNETNNTNDNASDVNQNANSTNNDETNKSQSEEESDKRTNPNNIELAPGESITATATYTITADDIKAGHVTNIATANGKAPDGSNVESQEATATTQITETIIPEQPQHNDVLSDLVQTGIEIALPSLTALIGIGGMIHARKRRRNRR